MSPESAGPSRPWALPIRVHSRSMQSFAHKPNEAARARPWDAAHSLRLRHPIAKLLSAFAATERLRQPRQQRPRFADERVRRIDNEKPCARKRLLAMGAGRPMANVKFESQDIWRAERGDRIEKTGVVSSVADRTPGDVSPGRPFAQPPLESVPDAARFAGRLERRGHQGDARPP